MSRNPKVRATWAMQMRSELADAACKSDAATESANACYEVSEHLYRAAELCRMMAQALEEVSHDAAAKMDRAKETLCEVEEP